MPPAPELILPAWPAPAGVVAFSTTRGGGHSAAPFDSFNLGDHVGDDPAAVAANRALLAEHLPRGAQVHWLSQVHGIRVVEAGAGLHCPEADASCSGTLGAACVVLTADCLPVLLCTRDGTRVAAAHAGWRGLLAGVLEVTVSAMGAAPGELLAWLGPAIGPAAFEVGREVREAFVAAATAAERDATSACFPAQPGDDGRSLADLYTLARIRLARAGVAAVYGGDFCTYSDPARFFSYRRDGDTGRMASLILRV